MEALLPASVEELDARAAEVATEYAKASRNPRLTTHGKELTALRTRASLIAAARVAKRAEAAAAAGRAEL